ncbi:MAG: 4-hydroxy-tetrahydrodipicolinate synthase [Saprospiraceae bacterium]|nr:4-hydroxy-tetrahydrodipicolinate synthase [Saprospiraceae bacterium]MDW8483523.1 4-hydroxy-tetrahydrodipicolinate synthase [Saprospiraceae bacterium]
MNNLHERLRGTGVALVTPFRDGQIDWEGLEKVIEHVIAGGVDFLVSLGTTGETVTISEVEQRQIIDFTLRVNRSRLPIVVGSFSGNHTGEIVRRMHAFDFDGIDALLISSPAYNKPSQEGIFRHYMALAEASPRPILLYNVPSRTASNITAETTLRLAHAHERFIGIKEASDDIYQICKILQGRPKNFLVLSGDDFITLPLITCGGDGVISVISNALPSLFSGMVRAALNGQLAEARNLNFQMLDLYWLLFSEGNPPGIKAALELLGLCSRETRLPLTSMSEVGQAAIRKEFERLKVL